MPPSYVQYGCGLSAPVSWLNFDVSPTLRIQKLPVLGFILRDRLNATFPDNVRYGDITRGLPVADDSCMGVYCSHVLEHLSLLGFRAALRNTYRILKPGGIFRCVLPDLEQAARTYLASLDAGDRSASLTFMQETRLGVGSRPRSLQGFMHAFFANSHHLWMWDASSLADELRKAGFVGIRKCTFHDSTDSMFEAVEEAQRFVDAVAIECRK